MKVLNSKLKSNEDEDGMVARRTFNNTIDDLKKDMEAFNIMCNLSTELNETFSVPVLFLLTGKFLLVITYSFTFIFSVLNTESPVNEIRLSSLFIILPEWIKIMVILASPEVPLIQVKKKFKNFS